MKMGSRHTHLWRLRCRAVPRSHTVSAFLLGGQQAGNPATRPVVIPLFDRFFGDETKLLSCENSPISAAYAEVIPSIRHGTKWQRLPPQTNCNLFVGAERILPN